ncbi:hypothetical protein HYPSUDRAFT_200698 [Hypholoma sublateritium FD-334 SS-4]|uniref:Uncharacterized protein n=1 Tax=Hypholoma sublateritium (strain FD-334 SS-4) TaxID=945553 RepID=A0A0D2LAG9_HYPSF|nr:hypothetical protein HYPSUDRAFT_200698 [Hypholoma sublateritium FD-334 SS-4]
MSPRSAPRRRRSARLPSRSTHPLPPAPVFRPSKADHTPSARFMQREGRLVCLARQGGGKRRLRLHASSKRHRNPHQERDRGNPPSRKIIARIADVMPLTRLPKLGARASHASHRR